MLKMGDAGADVGRLQQQLIEAGYAIDAGELTASQFGESTYVAVRSFQASHVGEDGHVLAEDGIVGPATTWALEHQGAAARGRFTAPGWRCSPSEVDQQVRPAVEAAVIDLARPTFEEPDGSNSGPRLSKYGNDGEPWCAFAVSYWFKQLPNGSPFGVIASAYKMSEWGKTFGRVLDDGQLAEPGDVFVILRGDYHGHVGLIVGVDDAGDTLLTIEGNCSNAVRGMKRARSAVTLVVRPVMTLS